MIEPVDLLDRWSRWVDELSSHPLDRFEYAGMLECRDRVAERLDVRSSNQRLLEKADARFEDLTINSDGTDRRSAHPSWWRERLPADERWREYLAR
jgi:hypothetical protein